MDDHDDGGDPDDEDPDDDQDDDHDDDDDDADHDEDDDAEIDQTMAMLVGGCGPARMPPIASSVVLQC